MQFLHQFIGNLIKQTERCRTVYLHNINYSQAEGNVGCRYRYAKYKLVQKNILLAVKLVAYQFVEFNSCRAPNFFFSSIKSFHNQTTIFAETLNREYCFREWF